MSKVVQVVTDTDRVPARQPGNKACIPRLMGIFLEMGCVSYGCHQHLLFIASVKIHPFSLFPQNLSPCFCPQTAHTRGTFPGCFCLKELSGVCRHRQQSLELPLGLWLRHIFSLHKHSANLPAFSNITCEHSHNLGCISSQPITWEICERLTP